MFKVDFSSGFLNIYPSTLETMKDVSEFMVVMFHSKEKKDK